jgi:hypothetical protein
VQFYPSVFSTSSEEVVALQLTSIGSQPSTDLIIPFDDILDSVKYSAIRGLLKGAIPDTDKARINILEKYEKPFFSIKWIMEKLPMKPPNSTKLFYSMKELRGFLQRYPNAFVMSGSYVNLKNQLNSYPCEKSVALEIIRLKSGMKNISDAQIFQSLSQEAQTRIRSLNGLKKFYALNDKFLHTPSSNNNNSGQVSGQASETQSYASSRSPSIHPGSRRRGRRSGVICGQSIATSSQHSLMEAYRQSRMEEFYALTPLDQVEQVDKAIGILEIGD